MTDRPAILVEDLGKSFGDVRALRGIDLSVPPATILALLGPNGAGKTTAVRILTTLLHPDEGRAEVAGLDVVRDAVTLRSVIGLAGQFAAVDPHQTGLENLEMVGRLYHLPAAEARRRAEEILGRFDLTDAADRTVRTYSGGMRRRLDLGASLVGRPAVLFLDEPTTGLDPRSRLQLWELIRELVKDGTTLLLTTQYMEEADRLADKVTVIDGGLVIAEGTSDELKGRVGGDLVEFRVLDRAALPSAAKVAGSVAAAEASVEEDTGRVVVPVGGDGSTALTDMIRGLDGASIKIADLQLRRPTLDDVFLALTGHVAETTDGDEPAAAVAGRRSRGGRR
ncbi:MAG: ATP-binding cassette domain-containing protein [Actinomycetota bacterium]